MDETSESLNHAAPDTMQAIAERLNSRLQWLQTEEQKAKAQYKVVRDERLRQEGALDCLRLLAKELGGK